VFGCLAYAHVKQEKLEPREKRYLFVEYPTGVKGYKLWNLESSMPRTMVSRDVTFDEGSTIRDIEVNDQKDLDGKSKVVDVELQDENHDKDLDSPYDQETDQQEENEGTSSSNSQPDLQRCNVARDRQRRTCKLLVRHVFSDLVSYALSSAIEILGDEPLTYEEPIHSKDFQKWQAAMKSKMESLRKNETWFLVERPLGQRVAGRKWLFKIKKVVGNDQKPRYKARIVARGFTQVPGIDFNEVDILLLESYLL